MGKTNTVRYVIIAVAVVLGAGILIAALTAYAGSLGEEPEPLRRPSESVIRKLGECEAVTVGNVTVILCTDGTEWIGVRSDPQPLQGTTP